MRIHVSSGRWITDYSASLCHCWINPTLHRLTKVIRLFSHQIHPSWSSWQPKALGELRHEIVGIPREEMSNNLLEPVTILDLCLLCFKLAERIRFSFSLCTVCSLLWSKKGVLLGMLLSFCMKEQITSFPLHWSKVFIYPLQSSQQLLVKYQCSTGCSSDGSKCHICHSFPVFVVLLWASLRREDLPKLPHQPGWWFPLYV